MEKPVNRNQYIPVSGEQEYELNFTYTVTGTIKRKGTDAFEAMDWVEANPAQVLSQAEIATENLTVDTTQVFVREDAMLNNYRKAWEDS